MKKWLLLLGLLAPACGGGGGSDADSDAFATKPAAVVTTDSGTYRVEVHSAPDATPSRGVNNLELVVTKTSDGTAAADLAIGVLPFMPAMGHGASVVPTVAPTDVPGTYRVTNVNFFMPGLWEVRTTIATTDHATAHFDIP